MVSRFQPFELFKTIVLNFASINFLAIMPNIRCAFEGKACINVTKQRPLRHEVYIHSIDKNF
jgi:hypothetical protein